MSSNDPAPRAVVLVVGDPPPNAPDLAGRPVVQHTLERAARVPGTAAVVRVPLATDAHHAPGIRSRAAARRWAGACLLYTSPSPRDKRQSRMPSSA